MWLQCITVIQCSHIFNTISQKKKNTDSYSHKMWSRKLCMCSKSWKLLQNAHWYLITLHWQFGLGATRWLQSISYCMPRPVNSWVTVGTSTSIVNSNCCISVKDCRRAHLKNPKCIKTLGRQSFALDLCSGPHWRSPQTLQLVRRGLPSPQNPTPSSALQASALLASPSQCWFRSDDTGYSYDILTALAQCALAQTPEMKCSRYIHRNR